MNSRFPLLNWMARTWMGLEKATVTVMIAPWWHLILLPQMRQRKGRAEGDTIHADTKSISPLTLDLRQSWNDHEKTNKHLNTHTLHVPCKVSIVGYAFKRHLYYVQRCSIRSFQIKISLFMFTFPVCFQGLTFWPHTVASVCNTIYNSF